MSDEQLDTDKVLSTLQDALQLQAQSILTMTQLAGSLRGLPGTAVKQSCEGSCSTSWRRRTCW